MKELRKLIFISPGLAEFGDSGHYSTLHKSLEIGCLRAGVSFQLSDGTDSFSEQAHRKDAPKASAIVYEGDVVLLLEMLRRPGVIPTYFNFLRSNDFLFLWLFLKIKGSASFDELKHSMIVLKESGWVFSADSGNLRTRLQRLGFPVDAEFPFSSAFSGQRNFAESDWDLGLMAETQLEWILNVMAARLASFIWPALKIKLLNTNSRFQTLGSQKLESIQVTSLPAVGEEYLDRLSAKFWFLAGKSSHHVFGSSGRSLDILANGGIVFTRKFNSLGAASKNEESSCIRSRFPRVRAVLSAKRNLSCRRDLQIERISTDRTAADTITSILDALGRQNTHFYSPKMNVEKVTREIGLFEMFCARKSTSLLFRALLRLPRWVLWKLTA